MKIKRNYCVGIFAAILCIGSAFAAGETWTSDFEAAKKLAVDGKKNMLLEFTGSDWCPPCKLLNKEVFSQAAFEAGVKDKLVLVKLDFPKDKSKLSEATITQNKLLQKKYSISGYPTILIIDEQGKPFAKTGYRPGGAEAYVTHIDELLAVRAKRDAAFTEADKLTGVEKAKALIGAIEAMELDEADVTSFYSDQIAAIKAADPKDESGYMKGIESKAKFKELQDQINKLASKQNFDGIMTLIDETLAAGTYEGELKQQTMIFKAMTFMQLKKPQDALKILDEAKAIAPESDSSKGIDRLKKRIEASIEK
jgi:thioredoxin-related protein